MYNDAEQVHRAIYAFWLYPAPRSTVFRVPSPFIDVANKPHSTNDMYLFLNGILEEDAGSQRVSRAQVADLLHHVSNLLPTLQERDVPDGMTVKAQRR
ncbi:MAG: hypothetical protein M1833_002642 [Piccolia ochrophora]|nr:MAG: hypothetical protein M1833_002642 [Piccolia ochrophora]